MRFSTRSEYGIRVMVRLGRSYGAGPVPLADLARQEDLPLPYLEQIAAQLRRAGLVSSRMGVKGGYALARRPETVSMADIVRSLEGSLAPVSCLAEGGGPGECTHADTPCSAHAFWEQLQGTITASLQAVSVADLMKERQPA
ncbi:MAG: RrF2 family transcriptional regulator [Candidatus Dormibacteraeota bacterium]|nr:RrF2 family transcriptional regulator [Candidatus Dormibacteraeota bacterium]